MQIVCWVNVRRGPTKDDNADFKPIVIQTSKIKKLSTVVAYKGYAGEDNHVLVLQKLNGYSIIHERNENVPLCKTRGRLGKKMKRGYNKLLYHQRNKDETIINYNIGHKKTVWRTYHITVDKNAE